MALYPTLFGYVELPEVEPLRRRDRTGAKDVDFRHVRPVEAYSARLLPRARP